MPTEYKLGSLYSLVKAGAAGEGRGRPGKAEYSQVRKLKERFQDWNKYDTQEEGQSLASIRLEQNLDMGIKTYRLEEGDLRYIHAGGDAAE